MDSDPQVLSSAMRREIGAGIQSREESRFTHARQTVNCFGSLRAKIPVRGNPLRLRGESIAEVKNVHVPSDVTLAFSYCPRECFETFAITENRVQFRPNCRISIFQDPAGWNFRWV